jgi:hypothetical protein
LSHLNLPPQPTKFTTNRTNITPILTITNLSSCRRSLCRLATISAFVVAPSLPSSSCRRCLHRRAAGSAFVVALLLPSSSRRRF